MVENNNTNISSNDNSKKENVTKKINFFSVTPIPNLFYNDPSTIIAKQNLIKKINTFNEEENITVKIDSTDYYFNISLIEYDNIFVCVSKNKRINDPFTEIRKGDSIIDHDAIMFNHFTYFYFDINKLTFSYIFSKNIGSPIKILKYFLFNLINMDFQVISYAKELSDINKEITHVDFKFKEENDFEDLNSIDTFGCEMKNLQISFTPNKPASNILYKLVSFVKKKQKCLKEAKVKVEDETYYLISQTFCINKSIEINSNFKQNLNLIRNILKEELNKTICG